MFVRSIARGSNYCIRSLWINTHNYKGEWVFLEKEGARFEVVHELPCISREEGGWANIKNGGQDRVVMVKTIIICVRLRVWAQ